MYSNPILKGDYSDPDVLRVGNDYYMISSSFTYFPGIPLLHSTDLVHWELVNYVVKRFPFATYDTPMHNRGTWAPSIRYHDGTYYVYVCAPDEGLFAFTTKNPLGDWACHHVKDVTGWIDPCPLWDDDGKAYLLHAFAASRAGIKSILYLHRMSEDGLTILDNGHMAFDGTWDNETTEGPKFYKINNFYYILAPAGGVATGWQLAMRADNPYGPYEVKRVLEQKNTPVNGPHQGGLIDTPKGEWWFIHFQDVGVYGRITHLQPVTWIDGFPVMGNNGAPVLTHHMPLTESQTVSNIPTSDNFTSPHLGLQWQWQANPNPAWYTIKENRLTLNCVHAPSLFQSGNFLSQLMQSFNFTWTVQMQPHFDDENDCAGLAMMGYGYTAIIITKDCINLLQGKAVKGSRDKASINETITRQFPFSADTVTLKMQVKNGFAVFSFSEDNQTFQTIEGTYALENGGWTSARPGLFASNFVTQSKGFCDVLSVLVEDDDQ